MTGRQKWVLLALLVAAVLFRFPAILNARALNSDPAVVGLQAMHHLRGEWSPYLWGAGYQGIVDSALVAAAFAIGGANAWSMMAVPLLGHLLVVFAAFDILRRRLDTALAAMLALPLVLSPRAINIVTLYPPRQWCITTLFAALWLIDRAGDKHRPALFATGTCLTVFSLYLDLFALQFIPGLVLFTLMCCVKRPVQWRPIAACVAGWAAGLVSLWILRRAPEATSQPAMITLQQLGFNLQLLWDQCLPRTLSATVFRDEATRWYAPLAFRAIQAIGSLTFVAGIMFGGLSIFTRRVPWPIRRLGILGCLIAACSVTGFLFSTKPLTANSERYLGPIIWAGSFALAPAAWLLGRKRFAVTIAPYLIAATAGGWLSFGTFVRGAVPVLTAPGKAHEEAQVGETLRQCGIRYATADYWLAYRLTFLWQEQPIVVPLIPQMDRHAPYRRDYEAADVVAYIFHPSRPNEAPAPYEANFRQRFVRYQRIEVAGFTILVVDRRNGLDTPGLICPPPR